MAIAEGAAAASGTPEAPTLLESHLRHNHLVSMLWSGGHTAAKHPKYSHDVTQLYSPAVGYGTPPPSSAREAALPSVLPTPAIRASASGSCGPPAGRTPKYEAGQLPLTALHLPDTRASQCRAYLR